MPMTDVKPDSLRIGHTASLTGICCWEDAPQCPSCIVVGRSDSTACTWQQIETRHDIERGPGNIAGRDKVQTRGERRAFVSENVASAEGGGMMDCNLVSYNIFFLQRYPIEGTVEVEVINIEYPENNRRTLGVSHPFHMRKQAAGEESTNYTRDFGYGPRILNHGQSDATTPELAHPLLTTTPHQRERRFQLLDRLERTPPYTVGFSGTASNSTIPATIRYLYHTATTVIRNKC
ncbi:hypothetical protein TNCV_4465651 [Trichonephila clavipes]|nr:hypothetical protein TNCV_4465651 [Trichonephila clavipes]